MEEGDECQAEKQCGQSPASSRKSRCRKSDSVEKACVEGGGESAEAEEIGCWCPGVLCQEVLGSSRGQMEDTRGPSLGRAMIGPAA